MPQSPRVCLIGAGSSGIPCIKALLDEGVEFECFEAGSEVGGNWCIRNDNGMSSAYDSLHINTSRPRMQYADLAMPADYPDYPGHADIKRYFDQYVDHFGLREHIRFGSRVENAERSEDGRWAVETSDGQSSTFDALVVASGHHWDPRWPDPPFPGQFTGDSLHAHHYRNPEEPINLRDRRVLVIGLGNSAMDIACELCRPGLTQGVVVSSRSAAWIMPKYLFGKPLDQSPLLPFWVPWRIRSAFASAMLRLATGRPQDFGLPRPEHRLLSAHPTVSQELLGKFGSGDLRWKPNVSRFDGQTVHFEDGSSEEFDAIVYCTGYNVRFPFLSDDVAPVKDNQMPLWLRLLHPRHPNLFFLGLLQPLGAIMPLAEAQSKLVAAHLAGRCQLPSAEAMYEQMERDQHRMQARYTRSARHTMQVDFDEYLWRVNRALHKGLKLARGASSSGIDSHAFWSRMPRQRPQEVKER